MSGEFGIYLGGYMHNKILYASEDCKQDCTFPVTHALGDVLDKLYLIAKDVSYYEASDISYEDALLNIQQNLLMPLAKEVSGMSRTIKQELKRLDKERKR